MYKCICLRSHSNKKIKKKLLKINENSLHISVSVHLENILCERRTYVLECRGFVLFHNNDDVLM